MEDIYGLNELATATMAELAAERDRADTAIAERDHHMKRADNLTEHCRGLDRQVLHLQEVNESLESDLDELQLSVLAMASAMGRVDRDNRRLRDQLLIKSRG